MAEGTEVQDGNLPKGSSTEHARQLADELKTQGTTAEGESQLSKVDAYLSKELPPDEPRITKPMDPACEVAIVVPMYRERENVLRLLSSLADQEDVSPDQFETILVINNPGEAPLHEEGQSQADFERKSKEYPRTLADNQETMRILSAIEAGEVPEGVTEDEAVQIQGIISSGLRVRTIDKASPGHTLPPGEAHVGGARNRGVAETVERFKNQAGHDGIIAQTDADCSLDEHYVANLIDAFRDPEVVGVAGTARFEDSPEVADIFTPVFQDLGSEYDALYSRMLLKSMGKKGERHNLEPGEVQFFGASMASRAFAAAEVGGVPKKSGGEDPAFSRALKEVGTIAKRNDVIAKPLRRESERTAEGAGHGQKVISSLESIRRTGGLEVPNPAAVPVYAELLNVLQRHLDGDSGALESLTFQQGSDGAEKPLFGDDEMDEIRAMSSGFDDVSKLVDSPGFQHLRQVISGRVGELFPAVGVDDATDRLVSATLAKEPDLRDGYEEKLTLYADREAQLIEERQKICEGYFAIVQPPNAVLTSSDQVVDMLEQNASVIGLSPERLDQIVNEPRIIGQLLDLAQHSTSAAEAMAGMTQAYPDELTPLDQNTRLQSLIKLRAVNRTHQEKAA